MTDHLVEIDRKLWPNLKGLYTPDGFKSYIAYTTIDTYIRWFEQDPDLKHIKFFCLNGDFSDGTFVVTVIIICLMYLKSKYWSKFEIYRIGLLHTRIHLTSLMIDLISCYNWLTIPKAIYLWVCALKFNRSLETLLKKRT